MEVRTYHGTGDKEKTAAGDGCVRCKRRETPGCLLMVIKDGEEQVYLESGYADIEAKKPVSRDNIFRLYSMSKPITATAMMILVERGIVDLADPVSKYLPGFRNPVVCTADGKIEKKRSREILLEDIMNMTSGLTYGGTDETGRQTDALFSGGDPRT